MCEKVPILTLTGKRIKSDDDFVIKKHLLFCNYSTGFDDFSIFTINNNDFKVTFMERDYSPLNKNNCSISLELFDSQGTTFHHLISRKIDSFGCSSVF